MMNRDVVLNVLRAHKPVFSQRYFGAQGYLEDLLGRPVDLATDQDLRVEVRPYVEREVIDA